MTTTTRTTTFTITSARYLTSKIAADLRTMNRLYGMPRLEEIDLYAEESVLLLRDGYLKRVDYGLRRTGSSGQLEWVLKLSYVVSQSGSLADDHPGGVPTNAPYTSASFYSYLSYSQKYLDLTTADQATVDAALPINRTPMSETPTAAGSWSEDRSYNRDGTTLSRQAFVAW